MKKVLLIENYGSDFFNSRLPLANFLKRKGYDVFALVPNDNFSTKIKESGIKTIVYDLDRKSKNIFQIIKLVFIYREIFRTHKFDIIHSFRFQPNLINVLSNLFTSRKSILHITGLGIAFSDIGKVKSIYYYLSQLIFSFKFLVADILIFQNYDDPKDLWFSSFLVKKVFVIEGSGVSLQKFNSNKEEKLKLRNEYGLRANDILFICVTRLLWEKGIKELVLAFDDMKGFNSNIKLWVVGSADKDNPRAVNIDKETEMQNVENVKFLGRREDVKELLSVSDVFIYPSYYREGIPRGILEAMAMELPVITTDTPGCNLTVIEGENGFLIKPRSKSAIIESVKNIINKDLNKFGKASKVLVTSKFEESIVFEQIEKLYK